MSVKFRMMTQPDPNRSRSVAAVFPVVDNKAIDRWGWLLLLIVLVGWGISYSTGFVNGLTLLAILSFFLTIAGLVKPGIGLLGISMFSTLDALTRSLLLSGGLLRWNTFNYWLLLVMLLYVPFLLRLRDVHTRLLQLFCLVLGFMLLFSNDLTAAAQDVLNIAASFGLLIYFAKAIPHDGAWYWMGIINGVMAALGGFVYFLQMDEIPYINPNTWAFFPLTALFSICFAFLFVQKRPRGKLILLILAAICMVWIFLTGSRGSMLMGVVCVGFLIVYTRSFTWSTALIGLAIMVSFAATNLMGEQQAYALFRIQKLFDQDYTLSQRTSGRSTLMEAGLQVFTENPFGVGTGNFRSEFSTIDTTARNKPAHSAWIKTLAENGFIGFLLLFGYVISFFIVGIRKKDRGAFLLGGLATVTLGVGFITREFQGKSLWFMAVGATVILNRTEMMAYLQGVVKNPRLSKYQRSREIEHVSNK